MVISIPGHVMCLNIKSYRPPRRMWKPKRSGHIALNAELEIGKTGNSARRVVINSNLKIKLVIKDPLNGGFFMWFVSELLL